MFVANTVEKLHGSICAVNSVFLLLRMFYSSTYGTVHLHIYCWLISNVGVTISRVKSVLNKKISY